MIAGGARKQSVWHVRPTAGLAPQENPQRSTTSYLSESYQTQGINTSPLKRIRRHTLPGAQYRRPRPSTTANNSSQHAPEHACVRPSGALQHRPHRRFGTTHHKHLRCKRRGQGHSRTNSESWRCQFLPVTTIIWGERTNRNTYATDYCANTLQRHRHGDAHKRDAQMAPLTQSSPDFAVAPPPPACGKPPCADLGRHTCEPSNAEPSWPKARLGRQRLKIGHVPVAWLGRPESPAPLPKLKGTIPFQVSPQSPDAKNTQ